MAKHLSKITDIQLLDLTLEGDEHAFSEIINRYQHTVATTAMNMLGDMDMASEIGQQVFIRFYKSISQFRREAKLSTYLTRITMNLCLNHLKRNQNFKNRSFGLELATNTPVKQSFEQQQEAKQIVNLALQYLTEDQRSIIVLRMIQGYSTQETAELLGIPKGTVLSRLKRAMDKLKIILTKNIEYER